MKKIKISVNKDIITNTTSKRQGCSSTSKDSTSKGINILNNYQEKIKLKRDIRICKSNNEVKEEKNELEKKHSKMRPFIFVIFIILIISVIYVFFTYGSIVGIGINKVAQLDKKNKIDFATTDEDIYAMYNNELLIYSNQTISTYSEYSKKTWEYKLAKTFTPTIYIDEKYMVVCNNSNGTIYLFENKKEILNKKIDGNIQSIHLDNKGNMAIEYSTNGYKRIISVFSKNGKLLYNAYLSNGAILDIKLLESAKKMLVVQAEATSFKIGATISIIDGTKEKENIVQIAKLDNNFVFDLTIQGEDIIMLLDNKIVKCNMITSKIQEIKTFDTAQFLFTSICNNYYTYISKELGDNTNLYKIVTARFDNSLISEMSIKTPPKSLKSSTFLHYLIYQDKIQVINKWGIEIKTLPFTIPPKNIVIFNDSKSVALIYTNEVYIVNM